MVRPKLEPGERIIWEGQPRPGYDWSPLRRPYRFGALLVAAIGLGAIAAIIASLGDLHALVATTLVGIATYAITAGLEVGFGDIFHDAHVRPKTRYILTNKSAYIGINPEKTREFKRFRISSETPVEFAEDKGAIYFKRRKTELTWPHAFGRRTIEEPVGFTRLENAREIHEMVTQIQTARTGDSVSQEI